MHDKAVSPIIATILLIAITVTLAATFYTEVTPYFTQNQYFTPQAQIQVISENHTSDYRYYIYVSYFPESLPIREVDISIISNGTDISTNLASIYPSSVFNTSGISMNMTIYTEGQEFNAGSYIFINISSPISYLAFVDVATGSNIVTFSSGQ
ncbi:archaellin/type IV pilin N-terminal domain-containing protein [Thermoplasma sp.]|uniref:archaellin/type IV pilin N-terminal domain-containing protein n=1 Tax=Thermoplasma sp. TaxID=1973142 RepID=UPI001270A8B2|nr:archaellin/type IV pilin N-terminal domain-containing protein [Thermoplasma sp.]KAA8923420.1 MAG: type IV pilin [Thermoplasma sp.]